MYGYGYINFAIPIVRPFPSSMSGPVRVTKPNSYVLSQCVPRYGVAPWTMCAKQPHTDVSTLTHGDSGGPWIAGAGSMADGAATTTTRMTLGVTSKALNDMKPRSATGVDLTVPALNRWVANTAGTILAPHGGCGTAASYACLLDAGSDSRWYVHDGFGHPIADQSVFDCLKSENPSINVLPLDQVHLGEVPRDDTPATCQELGPITPSTLPDAIQYFGWFANQPDVILHAQGGTGFVTYEVTAGALPDGLTLNWFDGAMRGVATTSGTYHFDVTATDELGATTTQPYTLNVQTDACSTVCAIAAGDGRVILTWPRCTCGIWPNGSSAYIIKEFVDGVWGGAFGPSYLELYDYNVESLPDGRVSISFYTRRFGAVDHAGQSWFAQLAIDPDVNVQSDHSLLSYTTSNTVIVK